MGQSEPEPPEQLFLRVCVCVLQSGVTAATPTQTHTQASNSFLLADHGRVSACLLNWLVNVLTTLNPSENNKLFSAPFSQEMFVSTTTRTRTGNHQLLSEQKKEAAGTRCCHLVANGEERKRQRSGHLRPDRFVLQPGFTQAATFTLNCLNPLC